MTEDELAKSYLTFLDQGKTERECVEQLLTLAKSAGFVDAEKAESLKAGDKAYVVRMGKAVALFSIGTQGVDAGFNILGAHIDSPRLDLKPVPLYEKDGIAYLNTHYYGGIKKYQWLALPLAIHGVVCKKDGTTVKIVAGESEDDTTFCISDILPHLAADQMEKTAKKFIDGEDLDIIVGSTAPQKDKDEGDDKNDKKAKKDLAKKAVLKVLKDKYNIEEDDFLSAELEVVPAGRAKFLGFDRSLILAYGHDDRSCAFSSLRAFMDSTPAARTSVLLCVDKEEIGSVGATGMGSNFFYYAALLIAQKCGAKSELALMEALGKSNMLSSDVNAAFDPQHTDLFDRDNASKLGGGIVFNKYTGSRGKSGASDANAEYLARLRKVLDDAQVSFQVAELGKVDIGGGGTIAYLAAKFGINVLDAGVSVLSMHAPWEVIAKADLFTAYKAYKAFLEGM